MSDITLTREGAVGHITLRRPDALNALTYEMALAIEKALDDWRDNPEIALIVIDAEGDRAFCAGGDLQLMYETAGGGNYDYGRRFWRDEYRLNAKIFDYPKPYVALMQGFTMGGGVGVSCHGSHRVVCETSRIAMPECGVGLVPDVGGSLLLARAPGRMGEYLGMTGTRMEADDAIHAGFADYFIPRENWPVLTQKLIETGDIEVIDEMAETPPTGSLAAKQTDMDAHFAGQTGADILRGLGTDTFGEDVRKQLARPSPLSMACTVELVHRVRGLDTIRDALGMEYRFTSRSVSEGEFLEGIRAMIIDKDRNPQWRHASLLDVNQMDVANMLKPLGDDALQL